MIELAITRRKTPKVQIAHENCIAIFLPKLSAIKGMIKNPINDPINTIDCKIVEVLSHSKYGSNWNTILFGWDVIIDFHCYYGELHTRFIHSFWLSNLSQVIESSKKKAIPSNSHAVKNHVDAMIKKDLIWYLPSPPTLSINFYNGLSWIALSSKSCF